MRQALLISTTFTYIDNDTCQPCTPGETERMIDAFRPQEEQRWSFVELQTKQAELKGKTLRSLHEQAEKLLEQNSWYGGDCKLVITK